MYPINQVHSTLFLLTGHEVFDGHFRHMLFAIRAPFSFVPTLLVAHSCNCFTIPYITATAEVGSDYNN